jgi:hypothetical protein
MAIEFKKVTYRLYLSIQVIVLFAGIGWTLFNIVGAIHDVNVSHKGRDCADRILGNYYRVSAGSETSWDLSLQWYLMDNPDKRKFYYQLESQCREYFHITKSKDEVVFNVEPRNYIGIKGATISERLMMIMISISTTMLGMLTLYGIRKWTAWLFTNSN